MAVDSIPLVVANLPGILAGPVLCNITTTQVSVWVALSRGDDVQLRLAKGVSPSSLPVVATVTPRRVGKKLWLAVLTGGPDPQGSSFTPNSVYAYKVTAVGSAWAEPDWSKFSIDNPQTLPSFRTSPGPGNLEDLVLMHTSCRDPRGFGDDALAASAKLFTDEPSRRPHLVVFSGDQIYADTVTPVMAPRVRRIAADLVGVGETVFPDPTNRQVDPIGGRQSKCTLFGLTSGVASDHLWSLGEFLATYLLAYSDVLWPDSLPTWDQIKSEVSPDLFAGLDDAARQKEWEKLHQRTDAYRVGVSQVRRVLASVPTLSVLDDHEVTDDWNLGWTWARTVYGSDAASRVIYNGVLAYVLCQHWGNRPDRFATVGTPENSILNEVTWGPSDQSHPHPDSTATRLLLGVPDLPAGPLIPPASLTGVPTDEAPVQLRTSLNPQVSIRYDFVIGPDEGWPFRLLVLDERTAREFRHEDRPAARVSVAALALMLPDPNTLSPPPAQVPVTLIAAPSPVLGSHIVEQVIQPVASLIPGGAIFADFESWAGETVNHQEMLRLSMAHAPVIFLGGDVHYTVTSSFTYTRNGTGLGAGITSSAARSADLKTILVQIFGDLLMRLGIERERTYYGYESGKPGALDQGPIGAPALPYDEMVDVLLGRVARDVEEVPAVVAREVAEAYALGTPDWSYTIAPVDDESMPPDDSPLLADINGAPTPWAAWDPATSSAMVKALRAADLHRFGRAMSGLPQISLLTFTTAPLTVVHFAQGPVGEGPSSPTTHSFETKVRLAANA